MVAMTVRVGKITQQLDVSLNDRATYDYPLLIGRDFLQDFAIADVSKKNIAAKKTLNTVTRKVTQKEFNAAEPSIERPVDLQGLELLGALENVQLTGAQEPFKARVDTGAETSSLDARDLEIFDKDGTSWVRFKLASDNESSTIELPVTRKVMIKRQGGLASEERPVVTLEVHIGMISKPTEFTLRDRSEYEFPVLIAERFLSETALVDVSQEYIARKAPKALETLRGEQ